MKPQSLQALKIAMLLLVLVTGISSQTCEPVDNTTDAEANKTQNQYVIEGDGNGTGTICTCPDITTVDNNTCVCIKADSFFNGVPANVSLDSGRSTVSALAAPSLALSALMLRFASLANPAMCLTRVSARPLLRESLDFTLSMGLLPSVPPDAATVPLLAVLPVLMLTT